MSQIVSHHVTHVFSRLHRYSVFLVTSCLSLLVLIYSLSLTSYLFLTTPPKMPPWAVWNMDCDSILLDVLIKQRESGLQTSNENFHTSTWTEAKKALAKTEMHTGGAPKSVLCCQNHWAAVTAISLLDFWHVYWYSWLFISSLRKTMLLWKSSWRCQVLAGMTPKGQSPFQMKSGTNFSRWVRLN